jgi:hypothetical protein
VADDLILNPLINENNYLEYFNLTNDSNFLPGFVSLHDTKEWWARVPEAFNWRTNQDGIEVNNVLPNAHEVLKKFKYHNLDVYPLKFNQIWNLSFPASLSINLLYKNLKLLSRYFLSLILNKSYTLKYPLVGGYSDVFIVTNNDFKSFAHYCGVFASMQLFVELAIPTSLVLAADNIVTEKNLIYKGRLLWTKEQVVELLESNGSLINLFNNFPANCLYIHPVKLSMWQH